MSDIHKLLPCPFCGSDLLDADSSSLVFCDSCGCYGPSAVMNWNQPDIKWNTRTAPKVKPLVWDMHPDEQEWYAKLPEIEDQTFERGYLITPSGSGFAVFSGFGSRARKIGQSILATEAKAVAQAYHECLILSTLEG